MDRSGWIRTTSRPRLAHVREKARELGAHLEKLSQRIAELRNLAQAEGSDPLARAEALQQRIQLQDSELAGALEELRAQNAALEEAHAVLEDERARYDDLFDAAPDAYVTTDPRGIIREANAAAAGLLGVAQRALPGKLLIGFVARRDTRAFRGKLNALNEEHAQAFSLHLRPRGGAPFRASLSVRSMRSARAEALELRWTIRPGSEPSTKGERDLLAEIALILRASPSTSGAASPAVVLLAEDIEQLVMAGEAGAREAISPIVLVERALARARAHVPDTEASIDVGSIANDVVLQVAPERATWAIARLLVLIGACTLRGRRGGSTYVLELRASSRPEPSRSRLAYAAVHTALAAEGGGLRIAVPTEGAEGDLVYEISLPVRSRDA